MEKTRSIPLRAVPLRRAATQRTAAHQRGPSGQRRREALKELRRRAPPAMLECASRLTKPTTCQRLGTSVQDLRNDGPPATALDKNPPSFAEQRGKATHSLSVFRRQHDPRLRVESLVDHRRDQEPATLRARDPTAASVVQGNHPLVGGDIRFLPCQDGHCRTPEDDSSRRILNDPFHTSRARPSCRV